MHTRRERNRKGVAGGVSYQACLSSAQLQNNTIIPFEVLSCSPFFLFFTNHLLTITDDMHWYCRNIKCGGGDVQQYAVLYIHSLYSIAG